MTDPTEDFAAMLEASLRAKRVEQGRKVERVNPAVDFFDVSLGGGGIPLFDNSRDATIRSDDATVSVRSLYCGRYHGGRGFGATVGVDQLPERLGFE